MNEKLLNIINIDELPTVRKSNNRIKTPPRNSIVAITILERLNKGVKVLIDGKLYIAVINENVALQEELVALVTDTEKFQLTLNLSNYMISNQKYLLNSIMTKLGLANNINTTVVLRKIIEERKPIIKSKVNLLLDFITDKKMKLSDSQLALLINILWSKKGNSTKLATELFDNLFQEPFEVVCHQLLEATKKIIYANIPSFILQQINNTIYDIKIDNQVALIGKKETIIEIVNGLTNSLSVKVELNDKKNIEKYIEYGTKYILQKSVLHQYDYYPDFVMVKKRNSLTSLMLEVKKYYSNNGEPFYNLVFKHKDIPIELKGIVRNNFLSGDVHIDNHDNKTVYKRIDDFQKELKQSWEINSHLTLNDKNKNAKKNTFLESGINTFA